MYKVVQKGEGFVSTFQCPGWPAAEEYFVPNTEYTRKEVNGKEAKVIQSNYINHENKSII